MVSIGRICKFLTAEELEEPYRIDPGLMSAFRLEGDFEWEVVVKLEETSEKLDETAMMRKELERQKAEKKAAKKEKQKVEKVKSDRNSGWWKRQERGGAQDEVLPSTVFDATVQDPLVVEEEPPFSLKDLKLDVHRGAFVAIVGRVGSGKVGLSMLIPIRSYTLTLLSPEFCPPSADWGDEKNERRGQDL